MVSQLTGILRDKVAKAFQGKLIVGTIRREKTASVDELGDPVPGSFTFYTFTGIRESFSAFYAARANIPDTDVKVLVLLGSVKPTIIQPDQKDLIHIGWPVASWHQVRRVLEVDPASATVSLQCTEITGIPGP